MFIGIGAAHDGQWSSSYVTRTQSIGESETALTPVETVFLWFYPLVTAGTMFEHTLNGSLRVRPSCRPLILVLCANLMIYDACSLTWATTNTP